MSTDHKRNSGGTPAATQAASVADQARLSDTAHVYRAIIGSEQSLGVMMDAMRIRLEALRDPLSPAALAELQRTMPILEALSVRFSIEAANYQGMAAKKALLLRAALQAQQAYARTFALMHTLALQTKNAEAVAIQVHPVAERHDGD